MLKGLEKLQHLLNKKTFIYLPSDPILFKTSTLSKAQKANQSNKQTTEGESMTAMFQLFASCEIVIISLLFLVLADINYPLLPIRYESDRLLLVGKFIKEDLKYNKKNQ